MCRAALRTDPGKARRHNEDSVIALPEVGLFAVADGMGGHSAGDYASHRIVEHLRQTVPAPRLAARVEAVEEAVVNAHREIADFARRHGQIVGSTVVILLVHGGYAITLWAGDSRLYRLRARGLRQMTTDHSHAEALVAAGLMTRPDALHHPTAHRLTRAVGVNTQGNEDVCPLEADLQPLCRGDRYLLCSDGLGKHVTDREIAEVLARGGPETAASRLVDLALERGGLDNVTVVVVDIRPDETPAPEGYPWPMASGAADRG